MKRKLIRQGDPEHGSYTVTLPASWVKKYGLKAGEEIDVEEIGNSLSMTAKKDVNVPKSVTIDARGFTTVTQLRRNIAEAYRSGAETIEVLYKDVKLYHTRTQRHTRFKDEIEHIVANELLGMEIEKSIPGLIIMKQFSEAIEEEFDTAFRKIYYKLQDQVDQAIHALQTMKPEHLRAVWAGDRGINKFCNFCMRILNKKGHVDVRSQNEFYAALVQLEFVGDMIYMIPMTLAGIKAKKANPKLLELLEDIKEAIALHSQYFYDRDEERFIKILKLREKYFEAEKQSFKEDGVYAASVTRIGLCFELLVNLRDTIVGIQKH